MLKTQHADELKGTNELKGSSKMTAYALNCMHAGTYVQPSYLLVAQAWSDQAEQALNIRAHVLRVNSFANLTCQVHSQAVATLRSSCSWALQAAHDGPLYSTGP